MRYEAEVGKVRQELQALMEKHESLELDSKTRTSELAVAIENAKSLLGKGLLMAHQFCLLMAHYWCAISITPLIFFY